jgi:hypothetical protein
LTSPTLRRGRPSTDRCPTTPSLPHRLVALRGRPGRLRQRGRKRVAHARSDGGGRAIPRGEDERPRHRRRDGRDRRRPRKLRGPGERANAQLKTWRILRRLRCCPLLAGQLVKTVLVLQLREAG